MKHLSLFLLSALAALSFVGCTTAPSEQSYTAAQASGESTCRRVVSPASEANKNPILCGNAAQWAEFDRRTALINAGVTCRWARTSRELCLNAAQWKVFDRDARLVRDAAQAANMGNEGAMSAAAQYPDWTSPYASYNAAAAP